MDRRCCAGYRRQPVARPLASSATDVDPATCADGTQACATDLSAPDGKHRGALSPGSRLPTHGELKKRPSGSDVTVLEFRASSCSVGVQGGRSVMCLRARERNAGLFSTESRSRALRTGEVAAAKTQCSLALRGASPPVEGHAGRRRWGRFSRASPRASARARRACRAGSERSRRLLGTTRRIPSSRACRGARAGNTAGDGGRSEPQSGRDAMRTARPSSRLSLDGLRGPRIWPVK